MHGEKITAPGAWRAADYPNKSAFSRRLQATESAAVTRALDKLETVPDAAIAAEHLNEPVLDAMLAEIRHTLFEGRGFTLISGFPVARGEAALGKLFLAFGRKLGLPVSQSPLGDRLGHVIDKSKPGQLERGYKSAIELSPHTDSDDIVAMLCIRPAKSGGFSRLVSAYSIYNRLLETAPEHLPILYRGFPQHWFGEEPQGSGPVTDYPIPILSWQGGVLSTCHLRERNDMAAEYDPKLAYSAPEKAALDAFDRLAADPALALEFRLDPGEAYFINNYMLLHARTRFEDLEPIEQRRLLLRLWVKVPGARPVDENVLRFYGPDGIAIRADRTDTAYRGDWKPTTALAG